jgi:hypothetical protein
MKKRRRIKETYISTSVPFANFPPRRSIHFLVSFTGVMGKRIGAPARTAIALSSDGAGAFCTAVIATETAMRVEGNERWKNIVVDYGG